MRNKTKRKSKPKPTFIGPLRAPKLNPRASKPKPRVMDVHSVCGLNDPFCEHSRGARIPGSGNIKSLPYTLRKSVVVSSSLSTSGVHGGAFLFLPSYGGLGYRHDPVFTLPNYIFDTLVLSGTTFNPSTYRIVSCGIVVRNINAPLTMTGMLRVRTFNPLNGTTLAVIDGTTPNYAQKLDMPFRDFHDVAIMSKKIDPLIADRFTITGETYPGGLFNPSNWECPGYNAIMVSFDGVQASTNVEIEIFYNYELTFGDNDTMSTLAVQSEPSNPIVKAASAKVQSAAKSIFSKGIEEAGKYIVNAAGNALGQAIGTFFGGPAGGKAGGMAGIAITDYALEVN